MAPTIGRLRAAALSVLAGIALTACTAPTAALPTAAPTAAVSAPEPTAAPAAPTPAPAEPTAAPTVAPAAPAPAGPVADPADEAAVALEQFLVAMHEARYEDAAQLYDGDYGMLQLYNPGFPADDEAGLLRQACEVNGFKCMRPASITLNTSDATAIYYDVTFYAADGSIFGIQVPGGSQVHSSFGLMVTRTPDGPRATTLPPFVS
jgi:hypothetical protein